MSKKQIIILLGFILYIIGTLLFAQWSYCVLFVPLQIYAVFGLVFANSILTHNQKRMQTYYDMLATLPESQISEEEILKEITPNNFFDYLNYFELVNWWENNYASNKL